MADIEVIDVDSPPPVEKKSSTSLRRRSSVAHSIRRSQSIVGISFEDQVSAIDPSGPIDERLAQVFNLSLSATCRAILRQMEDGDDEKLTSLAEHVRSEMMLRGPPFTKDDPLAVKLSEKIHIMSGLIEEASAPIRQLPPRLKNLQEYQAQVSKESDQWRDLHTTRKNRQLAAKTNLRAVVTGEKMIDDSARADLPRAVEAGLRSASDGRLELERLRQLTVKLEVARRHMMQQLETRRKDIDKMATEVDLAAKLICQQSSMLHGVDPSQGVSDIFRPAVANDIADVPMDT